MDQMELVEQLREKTGCSYSEAKAALDEAGNDLLEALCWLEQHGKTQMGGASCWRSLNISIRLAVSRTEWQMQ